MTPTLRQLRAVGKLAAVALLAATVLLIALIYAELDRPPDEAELRSRFPELLLPGASAKGLYKDHDSVELVFRAQHPHGGRPPGNRIAAVIAQAELEDWKVVDQQSGRVDLIRKAHGDHSIESLRAVDDPESGSVYYGWKPQDVFRTQTGAVDVASANAHWRNLEGRVPFRRRIRR